MYTTYNSIKLQISNIQHNTSLVQTPFFKSKRTVINGESVALLVAHRTNNRKVAGSRPTKVVYVSQC